MLMQLYFNFFQQYIFRRGQLQQLELEYAGLDASQHASCISLHSENHSEKIK